MVKKVGTMDRELNGDEPGSKKYLTFFLGEEEYGFDIRKVQEIIGMMDITPAARTLAKKIISSLRSLITGMMNITPAPHAPQFKRGVINLRGKVIPVEDLRMKIGMPAAKQTEETCIIVVHTVGVVMGVVVDRISDVLDIADENIDDAPSPGAAINKDYILGVSKSGDGAILLLDINRVIFTKEVLEIGSKTVEVNQGVEPETESDAETT